MDTAYTLPKFPRATVLSSMREFRAIIDPEWRYTRARQLSTENTIRFVDDDYDTVRLTLMLNDYKCSDISDLDDVELKYPEHFWAYKFYSMEYNGPRFHLEALVLAGMTTEDIADYIGCHPVVVSTYEKCFFDVRKYANKPSVVYTYINSHIASRGLRDLDPDALWKKIALEHGLDTLLNLWGSGSLDDEGKNKYDAIIASQVRKNALAALNARNVRPDNANEVVNEYYDMRRLEMDKQRIDEELGQTNDKTSEILSGLFSSVQFKLAEITTQKDVKQIESTPVNDEELEAVRERLRGALEKNAITEVENKSQSD